MRYYSELRYFDKINDDYVHLTFDGKFQHTAFLKALNYHNKYYKNEKAKINIFDTKNEAWCIESQTIKAK